MVSIVLSGCQSPVVVHEGRVPVHHPASDTSAAHLELTLAAGTQQQVDHWMAPAPPLSRQHTQVRWSSGYTTDR